VGSDQKRPDLAAKIIEGGINANQNNWYLPWIAGVNQFLFARSESKAAHYYRLAASYPEAPSWLTKQATIFESKMPALYKELRIWWNVYADSKDPLVKESARQRLIDLYLLEYREAPAESIRNAARDMCHNYLNYDIPRDYPTHPIIK
jgi:hypothetical protein